ncbi:TolC family protein [Burkholderia alba]|uniref:TolC family protein n=1 Tax=Burkholderia alba TaxID=2683677 RepID=UPI002B0567BD|nr:TolC family protein [Burkholderia alba]
MTPKPLALLLAAVFLIPPAHAQTPDAVPPPDAAAALSDAPSDAPITLPDALRIAAGNNPQLQSSRFAANATEGAFVQAGMRPNPEVSFLQESFKRQENTSTALVNQRIELGGKRGYRMDVAAYGREASLAALDAQSAAVRANVIAAFYGLLAAQKTLSVSEESTAIAQRSTDLVARRVSAGKVSPVEETKARVALAAVQIELTRASTNLSAAREKLANALGKNWPSRSASDGGFETLPGMPPLVQLQQRLEDAPLTRQAVANLRQSNARIALERARRIPDVTVSAGYKRVTTGGRADNQAVVGVSIPLPIFDTNRGAIMEATHNAAKADADLASERLEQRLALAQAYSGYESASQEARRLKGDVLPAAREALDAMSRGYALGKFQFLDVLDAQRTLFDAQTRYIRALTDAHLAYAELDRLVGTPLDVAAVRQPNQP